MTLVSSTNRINMHRPWKWHLIRVNNSLADIESFPHLSRPFIAALNLNGEEKVLWQLFDIDSIFVALYPARARPSALSTFDCKLPLRFVADLEQARSHECKNPAREWTQFSPLPKISRDRWRKVGTGPWKESKSN